MSLQLADQAPSLGFSLWGDLLETLGMDGESHPTPKNLLIYPIRKIPLNKFTSYIKSVIPSPSNSNFHVITLCKVSFVAQLFLLYHFFNFSLYVHTS